MHKRICMGEAEVIDRGLRRRHPEGKALPLRALRAAPTPRGRARAWLRAPRAVTAAAPRLAARCWGRGEVLRPGGTGGRVSSPQPAPGAIVPGRSAWCAGGRALGTGLVCRPCPCGGIDLQPRLPFVNVCPAGGGGAGPGGGEPRSSSPHRTGPGPSPSSPRPRGAARPLLVCSFVCLF